MLLVLEKDTSLVLKIKDILRCKSKETYLCGMNDWCLLSFNFSLDTDHLSKNVSREGLCDKIKIEIQEILLLVSLAKV